MMTSLVHELMSHVTQVQPHVQPHRGADAEDPRRRPLAACVSHEHDGALVSNYSILHTVSFFFAETVCCLKYVLHVSAVTKFLWYFLFVLGDLPN